MHIKLRLSKTSDGEKARDACDCPEVMVIPATPATETLGGAPAIGNRAKIALESLSTQEVRKSMKFLIFP